MQQANRDLENRLKDALNEQVEARRNATDAEERNLELLSELKNMDRMSKKVEESKERDVNSVKRDLEDARVSLLKKLVRSSKFPNFLLFIKKKNASAQVISGET